jgi:hypothetical protein
VEPFPVPLMPHQLRRNALARLLCASLMGLTEDATGANLPDDLWAKLLPKADAILFIVSETDRPRAGEQMELLT